MSAVAVEGIRKRFGRDVALDDVHLVVEEGSVLGLLGPNGAGKTTLVRILTTLLAPDAGRATVLGLDVVRDAARLRHRIGLAGQYATVDELLTGRENLRMFGRLYRLSPGRAARRADELLERFDLSDAADRRARTYSGGMRRRLDLAASLVNDPPMLFLDEPTTGLDPRSRTGLWGVIEDLVAGGTTLLLTTQYLEEADRLADRIAVIDHGRIIAEGAGDELKDRVGGRVVDIRLRDPGQAARACEALAALGCGEAQPADDSGRLSLPAGEAGVGMVAGAARALDAAGIEVTDLALRRPTLDDVFLTLTDRTAHEAEEETMHAAAHEAISRQAGPGGGR